LWSPVVATDGNQLQIGRPAKPQKQAKSVATGCHRLPARFHGKEGVDGSSPSEGLNKKDLQMGILRCLHGRKSDASRVRDGYILGLAGTRGHPRRLATQRMTWSGHAIATNDSKGSCKAASCVARTGAEVTTSFAKRASMILLKECHFGTEGSNESVRFRSAARASGSSRARWALRADRWVVCPVGRGRRAGTVRR
jgi:hypothetical protein